VFALVMILTLIRVFRSIVLAIKGVLPNRGCCRTRGAA
jgi:hypothetical protein